MHIHCYIDDLLSLNNPTLSEHLDQIYPSELDIKETSDSTKSDSYPDLFHDIDQEKNVSKIFDKRDDANFSIVNFPYLCGNIPASPA